VIQPLAAVTLIVIPPARVATQVSAPPWRVSFTGDPATATRALVGANASWTRTVEPRRTIAVFVEAAIGAPQRGRQHHDDTASGT
jgi:hypothetical protein